MIISSLRMLLALSALLLHYLIQVKLVLGMSFLNDIRVTVFVRRGASHSIEAVCFLL